MAVSPPEGEGGAITGINVTPLVDVVLVLLIIFMATAPLMQKRVLAVNVPRSARSEAKAMRTLALVLTAPQRLEMDGRPYSLEDVAGELRRRQDRDPALHVSLAADEKVPYGAVIEALDAVRSAGVKKVALDVRAR
jgi:biopolymer transport protein ExbD